jgi:hypothetical protein
MDDKPTIPEPSPEMRKFIEMVTKALVKSAQRARKLVEMTGTPLVVVEFDTYRSSSSVNTQNK